MTNLGKRLLVFAIGLPVIASTPFVAPHLDYPLFALVAICAAAWSGVEMSSFLPLEARDYRGARAVAAFLGALIPTVGYLTIVSGTWSELPLVAAVAAVAGIMWLQLWSRPDRFAAVVPTVTGGVFLIIYPGLFTWYGVRMVTLPNASTVIATFFLAVYLNDSLAYVTGMLFGQRKRNPLVAVSPNKSRIGFLGGFVSGVAVIWVAGILSPATFGGSPWRRLLFGTMVAVAAIVGDLAESALKRSAKLKDSGDLIPGRGGLLDSMDSPLFAAPFFYYGYVLLLAP